MKPNNLLRDLNDPTWREKEQAHYAKLLDATPTVKQSLQVPMTTQTAEKIASELDMYNASIDRKAAAMLRSQAAEIERLRTTISNCIEALGNSQAYLKANAVKGFGMGCIEVNRVALDAARAALESTK